MIAEQGPVNQQLGLNPLWGNALMAVFTAVTVLTGIKGVINHQCGGTLSSNISCGRQFNIGGFYTANNR